MPGDNANAGTSAAAPKRDLTGFNVNALPAGAQVLFARGGAWTNFRVMLKNLNATPTQPLVLDSYATAWGGNTAPLLKVSQFVGLEFGHFNDTDNDGGYTVRNLKLDGEHISQWGAWLRTMTRNVTLENLEITRFEIAVHASLEGATGNTAFTLRNSNIHHNSEMGLLGAATDSLIEGNTFADNNFSGSAFNHAIYLGSGSRESRNMTVRNNTFRNNSTVNGRCIGGNVTVHGQWDGVVFEGNTMTQDVSDLSCYGFSINPGYDTPEWFRNFVVRGNTIVNLGGCGICISSAPGVRVENNVVVSTTPGYHAAITVGGPIESTDAGDGGAIIRNNSIYLTQNASGSEGIRAIGGAQQQVVSNVVYFGAGAPATHYCYRHTAASNYTAFSHNLCYHAGGNGYWSANYPTLAAAQGAGLDAQGLSSNPLFVATPSASNGWSLAIQLGSPALNAAHPTLSAPLDKLNVQRVQPDMGAYEVGR